MTPRQKVNIFGSAIVLAIVGIVFIVKGLQIKQEILLFLGILLIAMGVGRYGMLKKYLPKDMEDTSLDDYLEEDNEEEE